MRYSVRQSRMKRIILALSLLAACPSLADRLFRIPHASVLDPGAALLEFDRSFSDVRRNTAWLHYGLTDRVELAATREGVPGREPRESLNLYYSYLPPIGERFPGIGVGVRDLMNRTEDGRAYYLALTYSVPLENGAAYEKDFTLSFGVGGGGIKGLFVGFDLPLTNNFSLQAEHDSQRVSAGVLWSPSKAVGLRLFMQQDRLQGGIVLSRKL